MILLQNIFHFASTKPWVCSKAPKKKCGPKIVPLQFTQRIPYGMVNSDNLSRFLTSFALLNFFEQFSRSNLNVNHTCAIIWS
jgi:hypothetical protein